MSTPQSIIELDGAQGEGGGQVLRTALTLSVITGTPFRIRRIRARRAKPGLLRQHLTAVQAAATISGATVDGATPGSQTLSFAPSHIRAGDYRFAIGTAGSCTLVLQTILPALWFAGAPSTVHISGGTHNPAAPPADFLMRAWAPLVARMGAHQRIELLRHGFYPAGGGEIEARVEPCGDLHVIDVCERGALQRLSAVALVAGVPHAVGERELERLASHIDGLAPEVRALSRERGPGNVLWLEAETDAVTEVFTAFGEKGVSAETVADRLALEANPYLTGAAAIGEHLADQLLLPMALAGGGSFTTTQASSHLRTNIEVIEKFLPVEFTVEACETGVRVAAGT